MIEKTVNFTHGTNLLDTKTFLSKYEVAILNSIYVLYTIEEFSEMNPF